MPLSRPIPSAFPQLGFRIAVVVFFLHCLLVRDPPHHTDPATTEPGANCPLTSARMCSASLSLVRRT